MAAETVKKRFDTPDEVREVPKARIEVLNLGDSQVMRGTYEPGWKWSESVKQVVGTDSCEVDHFGYVVSGSMVIRMNDGKELTFHAGDAVTIPPGHDAWVAGNEPCVFIDFRGATNYAKPKGTEAAA